MARAGRSGELPLAGGAALCDPAALPLFLRGEQHGPGPLVAGVPGRPSVERGRTNGRYAAGNGAPRVDGSPSRTRVSRLGPCHHRRMAPSGFNRAQFEREIRAAQRKAEQEWRRQIQQAERDLNREVSRVNRENERRVNEHNRKVDAENKRRSDAYNREVDRANREDQRRVAEHNRKADRHNQGVIDNLNRQLRAASSGPRYTVAEEALADRVQHAIGQQTGREVDAFFPTRASTVLRWARSCGKNWRRVALVCGLTRLRLCPARAKRARWTRDSRKRAPGSRS